jgi:hypothetical protein
VSEFVAPLDLGAEVARVHAKSASGTITVVAVVVDELESALTVLRAVCDLTDGVLLDADDLALTTAVNGTTDPVIRAAVVTALGSGASLSRHVVLVNKGGGQIDAEFRNPPTGASPSPGERTVLALARAVVHRDLDDHEFAVIAYRDSVIDLQFREAIWNLGVKQLAGMPHRTLRTVVFVAESAIDIGLHCDTEFGFRFALEKSRMLKRSGRDNLNHWAAKLAAEREPIVLFLGAGFAASSRLPLGNSLRDSAIRRLLGISVTDPLASQQLADRFFDWIDAKDDWLTPTEKALNKDKFTQALTLEQVIRAEARTYEDLPTLAEFKSHHDKVIGSPGSAVLDLADILRNVTGQRLILVEVNFDLLVERHSPHPLKVFASDDDFKSAKDYLAAYLGGTEAAIPLLKLHGSIDQLDTCIVSADQTAIGLPSGKLDAIRALLPTDERRRRWVYIGASMRDHDLLRVFRDSDFASRTDEVWVAPYLADTVEEYAHDRLAFWRNRELRTIDDRLITVTADAFFGALRQAWPTP